MSTTTSGGVTLTSDSTHIGGDVTGRDKIAITTNNYYGDAENLSRELMRAVVHAPSPAMKNAFSSR
jgi:hypothetical protein